MQKIKDFDFIGCYVTLLRALGSFAAIPFCCLLFAALRLCVRFSVVRLSSGRSFVTFPYCDYSAV